MKNKRLINAALTLPQSLLKDAVKRSTILHGRRGFSRYVRSLIEADLAPKPSP